MLLGSPPDMVHGFPLRGTGLSSPLTRGRRHSAGPGAGIHPCCSGLQVQGTANSPTSAVLLRAGPSGPGPSRHRLLYYILRNLSIPDFFRMAPRYCRGYYVYCAPLFCPPATARCIMPAAIMCNEWNTPYRHIDDACRSRNVPEIYVPFLPKRPSLCCSPRRLGLV